MKKSRMSFFMASLVLQTMAAVAWGASGVPATITIVTGNNQSARVNTAVSGLVCVQVKDSGGAIVTGTTVTFAIASGGGALTGASPATDGSGVATLGSWTLGATPGANTLTVSCGQAPSIQFTATATAAAGVPASITIVQGNNQSAAAGTSVAGVVCVQIRDGAGSTVTGTTVTYAVASGGGSITGSNPSTDGTGIATLGSWTLGSTPGTNTLTVSCGQAPPITFTATATAATPANIAIVTGNGQSAPVSTAVPGVVCVKVTDAAANAIAGSTVTYAVLSGGGSITGATPMTDASGLATLGSWTLGSTPGTNTLTVTCGAAPAITFTATAGSGAASKITIAAGNNQSAPVNTAVGGVVCVRVTDETGRIVSPGTVVNYAVASGGGTITGATPATDTNGIATLGSWLLGPTAGANTLSVTCGTAPAITFNATATPPGSGPTITSSPVALPNPATVGTTVSFAVVATGKKLTYTWTFGDGSAGAGATATHNYTAPGIYVAGVSISDAVNPPITASVSVTVIAAQSVVGTGPDSDGDGFSDAFESAILSDPQLAANTPTGQPITPATLQTLTLSTASIKLNFARSGGDTIAFTGVLTLPSGFVPDGVPVYFGVGGVAKKLTLTAKGSGVSGGDSIKLAINSGKFNASFKNGNFAALLVDSGITSNTESGVMVTIPFTVIFNNIVYQTPRTMSYTAKKGKTGSAK